MGNGLRACGITGAFDGIPVRVDRSDSTLQGLEDDRLERRGHVFARLALLLLTVIVLLGAGGVLGLHTSRVSAVGGGYRVQLDYPRMARAGLDVVWHATVEHRGGFDKTVTLAVTGDYFGMFETQGFFPGPDSEMRSGDTLYLTFLAPPGDILTVDYDAYVQPASQIGRDGSLSVLSGGNRVATVSFSTWLAP